MEPRRTRHRSTSPLFIFRGRCRCRLEEAPGFRQFWAYKKRKSRAVASTALPAWSDLIRRPRLGPDIQRRFTQASSEWSAISKARTTIVQARLRCQFAEIMARRPHEIAGRIRRTRVDTKL